MFLSMDFKRLAFSEPFLSHRRKVFSGFSLSVAVSLIFLTLLFLSYSLRAPKFEVFLPALESIGANPSFSSCSFNNNHSSSSGYNGFDSSEAQVSVSFTENGDNASLHAGEQGFSQKTDENNGALVTDEGNLFDSSGKGIVSGKSGVENSSRIAKDVGLLDDERRVAVKTSPSSEGNMEAQKTIGGDQLLKNNSVGNSSYSVKPGMEGNHVGDLIEKNNVTVIHNDSQLEKLHVGLYENCDIFDGKWVRDDSKPYYPSGSCPFIDRDFDCHLNGRPDGEYVKWKWQPNGCNIPRYCYCFSLTTMKCYSSIIGE